MLKLSKSFPLNYMDAKHSMCTLIIEISHISHSTLNASCNGASSWKNITPFLHYIKDTKNTLAYALSRLPRSTGQSTPGPCQTKSPRNTTETITPDDEENNKFAPCGCPQDILEYFLNYPAVDVEHPLLWTMQI